MILMWGQCGEGAGEVVYIERWHFCGDLGEGSVCVSRKFTQLGFKCTGVYGEGVSKPLDT